ncbi:MAG: UDP-N-acetylmuramoyl-L-alanine--D-glutamate ligase [Coriobacteriales bacterium]|jgi:UDP-N-acetylmuramoylalanine--D-glutamate ligase|nr:UDP-N-acetylmuramoyl-L-alanine--D-glutamate ligase [Coriobacteriales bacterium]
MCANEAINKVRAVKEVPCFGAVCLLGLGVTGQAVVAYFLAHPHSFTSLTVYAGPSTPETLAYVRGLPAEVQVHRDSERVRGSFDTTVVSPGIAPASLMYQSALATSRLLISEPELAWRVSGQRWIAITGTNGKTTVTELTAHLLRNAGIAARVGGNIGTPCIQVVRERAPDEYLVAELSSYQLHSMRDFAPEIAVLLNITPDHLHWHGDLAAYVADKCKIVQNLASERPAVVDATLPETREVVRHLRREGRRVIPLGTAAGITESMVERCGAAEAAYVDGQSGRLTLKVDGRLFELIAAERLQLQGAHNYENALAAAVCAASVGLSAAQISAGLASFKPLEHRFEPCGQVEGVNFVNDSKATNTDAAIKAIIAFADDGNVRTSQVLVMLGGVDKGVELDGLVAACQANCKYAICYGQAAQRFYAALAPALPTILEPDFGAAFARATQLAQPGDTVLLAPACASFDEFASFEARGEAFKRAVQQLGVERDTQQKLTLSAASSGAGRRGHHS